MTAKIPGLEDLWLNVPARFVHAITSQFNEPRDYSKIAPSKKQAHEGIDFAPVPINAKGPFLVVAAYQGRVDFCTNSKGAYGYYCILSHKYEGPQGVQHFLTWYCHLEKIITKPGNHVLPGDTIGYAGQSGNVTGRHLHFNLCIYMRGEKDYVVQDVVDPLPYLVAG